MYAHSLQVCSFCIVFLQKKVSFKQYRIDNEKLSKIHNINNCLTMIFTANGVHELPQGVTCNQIHIAGFLICSVSKP
jgi:hypothetical protein